MAKIWGGDVADERRAGDEGGRYELARAGGASLKASGRLNMGRKQTYQM